MFYDFIGRSEEPLVARDPVSLDRVRMFLEAIGADPGKYLVDHIAPPALLQAWTLPGLGPVRSGPTVKLYRRLDDAGYPGLIAVGYRQEYLRPLVPGDVVTASATIASVSAEKRTWVGPGFFLATDTAFTDAAGAVVGRMTWTVFKYRPTEGAPRPAPESTLDDPLVVPVTATMIVGGALATNDYTPIHHDVAAARAAGFADIFMNILTTCGLVHRYVTERAGGTILGTEFRLGTPVYPGDTLTFTGRRDGRVVSVLGRTDRGVHVHGTVTTSLPTVPRQ